MKDPKRSGRAGAGGRAGDRERGLRRIPLIAAGAPHVEIIRRARAAGAEGVLIGRHGRRTVRDLLIGSTASRVMRKADFPVLREELIMSQGDPLLPLDQPHTRSSAQVLETLATSVQGSSRAEAAERLVRFGRNTLPSA